MMKILEMEGEFRCRRRFWKPGLVVCIFTLLVLTNVNVNACGENETLQCKDNGNPSDCSCVKCLDCPPGQGLYPQCGTRLKGNMTMKCTPCKIGMYSDRNDFESCHPCHVCIGQETLRKCTPKQNAICKEVCMDGYQWNKIYHMCQEVPTTPKKERSTSPPHKPTTRSSAKTSTLELTKIPGNINASERNDSVTKTKQTKPIQIKPPTAPHKHNWITSAEIVFYVLVIVFALILLAVGFKKKEKICRFFCHLYCSRRRLSSMDQQGPDETSQLHQQEQELEEIIHVIPSDIDEQRGGMDSDQSTTPPMQQGECSDQDTDPRSQLDPQGQDPEEIISDNLQIIDHAAISNPPGQQGEGLEGATAAMPDVPDLCGQLLKDLSPDWKRHISVKISKKDLKGWKEMGAILEVPMDTLDEFETICSYGEGKLPGKLLLEFFEGSRPRLTINEFIEALDHIERKDVIVYIHEKYRK